MDVPPSPSRSESEESRGRKKASLEYQAMSEFSAKISESNLAVYLSEKTENGKA
jgi:hypothetical protein